MDEKWLQEQLTKILTGGLEPHELSKVLDEIRDKNTESVQETAKINAKLEEITKEKENLQNANTVSKQLEEMTKEKELLQDANVNLINENARLFAKQPTKVEDSTDPSQIENNEGKEIKTLDNEGIQGILENGLE